MNKRPLRIEIYSKPDCHLCDVAKEVIKKAENEFDLELVEINIEEDEASFHKYRYDIPVVMINGRKAFKHRVDEDKLRKRLLKETTY